MGADDHLTALSARVLASLPDSARRTDGEWDAQEVSKALHNLHASIQQQLTAQEAELDHVQTQILSLRATAPEEARGMQRHVEATALEIDEIQAIVESSEAHFSELVALLEPKTQLLQVLDARRQYLEMAMEVERRSQEAKACAVQATAAALDAFQAFSLFVQTIPSGYVALRREAMRRVEELSYGIKLYAVQKLQTALEAIEWPRSLTKEELVTENVKMEAVAQAFAYLLTLHVSQLQADAPAENKSADNTNKNIVELWALECLLEPIRLRFRFHFERNESKTNRITKPEWFLSHVLEQTRAHRGFLSRIITPQLQTHRGSLDCVDASVLFLRGLIQTASKKLSRDVVMALSERAVFCHLIDEVLLFEQAVDDEFGYDSYAASKPQQFPRVVDVLTEDPSTLLAWTKIDLEYAKETLANSILKDTSTTFAWRCSRSSSTTKIPAAAQQFMALLDFLCRRFAHLSQESHRYVYLSQVHFGLLQDFRRVCGKRAHKLKHAEGLDHTSLVGILGVVNSAQHVVNVLEAWDESPFFIELLRKVAESDKSRTQILKMHLESSKLLLKNAARAATHTIMAREEAVAVRQAIAGPGAMIGPTAAFSAAYSVGSKTVKSLFGRSDGSETTTAAITQVDPLVAAQDGELHTLAKNEIETAATMDAETLLFSRTVFEQFVREYKSLVATLIADIREAVLSAFKRALYAYRTSPHWVKSTTAVVSSPELVVLPEISSELGSATALLHRVLKEAHDLLLSEEIFSQLWKPLVASLDDAIFSAASSVLKATASSTGHGTSSSSNTGSSSGISGFSLTSAATAIGAVESSSLSASGSTDRRAQAWSPAARAQFIVDVNAVASVFQQVSAKNPRAYLRKTFDLCRVVEMPSPKLREIHEALRGNDDDDTTNGGSSLEQLTTILEACNILTLTPHQVQSFCEHQLGLQ